MGEKKRLYVFDTEDSGYDDPGRFAVVHKSLREAKKWLWGDLELRDYCDNEYVNLNAHWLREVDVSDLSIGDDLVGIEGIKRGVYTWVDGETCPICGRQGKIQLYDDWEKICCSQCDDDFTEAYIQKAVDVEKGRSYESY